MRTVPTPASMGGWDTLSGARLRPSRGRRLLTSAFLLFALLPSILAIDHWPTWTISIGGVTFFHDNAGIENHVHGSRPTGDVRADGNVRSGHPEGHHEGGSPGMLATLGIHPIEHVDLDHGEHCHGDVVGCSDVPLTNTVSLLVLLDETERQLGAASTQTMLPSPTWSPFTSMSVSPEPEPPRA